MRRGILGGTFDPVHLGHLLIAEAVRVEMGLQEVLFILAGQPWMKSSRPLAPAQQRWEMLALAVASNPFFTPSRVEMEREGPSYAVDTLRELLGQGKEPDDYYFIMGMDTLRGLPRWREPRQLLELCRLAVVGRPGHRREGPLAAVERRLPGVSERVVFVDGPLLGVSSTDIRRRCREGLSIRYRVPAAVEEYILKHGLYR